MSKHATKPKNNAAFWRKKIARNIERDREVFRFLRKVGWRGVRIWEHELTRKNERRLVGRLRRIFTAETQRRREGIFKSV